MTLRSHGWRFLHRTLHRTLRCTSRDDRASQIVEFAVSMPLLVIFIFAIFDFSGAYTMKQKLANAAREGARAAAADPANDLIGTAAPVPVSVGDAKQVVDNYLKQANINDCGLNGSGATPAGTLTWKYTATGGGCAAGGIVVTINRGYYFAPTSTTAATNCTAPAPPVTAVVATCVSVQYAYQWRFNRVIGLLGLTTSVPSSMTTIAVAMNEN